MKKSTKITIAVIVAVLVVGSLTLASQSGLFQGRLFFKKPTITQIDYSKLYLFKNKIVSAVTSPVTSTVPSVVVSGVTSPGGTSQVASVVVSAVTSPVASAVAVDRKTAANVDTKKLKTLTESTLRSIEKEEYSKNKKKYENEAKEEYKRNPGKFTLPEKEKETLIDLYKKANPSEFIFRPASR